jgi:hypothetical protein
VTGHGETFDRALAVAARLAVCKPGDVASTKELINQWPAQG